MSKIREALLKRFKNHRIIFWYEAKLELLEEFETLGLDIWKKIGGSYDINEYIQGK
ncbi:hypothetical protein OAU94_02880 [Flavobacteriaceae bacterium]|nr:hypothetical protein [Flavobacteriaceae bacterium]